MFCLQFREFREEYRKPEVKMKMFEYMVTKSKYYNTCVTYRVLIFKGHAQIDNYHTS